MPCTMPCSTFSHIEYLPSSWTEGHSKLKALSMGFKPGLKTKSGRDLPGGPAAKTLYSQHKGSMFDF